MNLVSKFEIYLKRIIKEKRKGPISLFLKSFLRVVSWGFALGVTCRNRAYDRGWLRRYYPPVPVVISIGNIVAGGTGKTPLTSLLAQHFSNDFIVAILSRGYRSPLEKFSDPVMINKGEGPIYPASLCGDEPYLMAKNLLKTLIFVGPNRQKSAHMAAKAGAEIILLDDGMQHRKIARDFEVAVINAQEPFGHGYFLPRGLLRDNLSSLARADLIVLNHVSDRQHFDSIEKALRKHTGNTPIVGTELAPCHYYDLNDKEIETIKGKRIGLFCGLGYPDQFRRTAQKEGAIIVDECLLPDHLSPSQDTLKQFSDRCLEKGADFLLCTEKDRVKLPLEWNGSLPIVWMKNELILVEGKEYWEAFLSKVKEKLK